MSWKNEPFLLSPAGKDYLWGGDRLNKDFHKNIDLSPLAETWECSTHPDGLSMVASGNETGKSLRRVLTRHPEYLGSHAAAAGAAPCELPVLVKLIDARRNLSVQVHPDDAYAKIHERGALGKSEMWYVLDAAPDAYLVHGFTRNMTESLLRKSLERGDIEKYLRKVPVQKDDVFFIPAGTVHAIGAGILLAEVQENSNLTYRLYDYERTDKDGRRRPLHVEKALQVLNRESGNSPRQPMRVLRYHPGYASELLCRCKYFQVERILVNTSADSACDCSTTEYSFQVLLCLEGQGGLRFSSKTLHFRKGGCIFLPSESVPTKIYGDARLLRVSC